MLDSFVVLKESDWPAAWDWLSPKLDQRSVLALEGNLGAGKTSFAKAILAAHGFSGPVTSPTFSLVQQYPTAQGTVTHLDLYRLTSVDEVLDLGFEEYLDQSYLTLVEWPQLAADLLLPDDTYWLRIEHRPQDGRLLLAL